MESKLLLLSLSFVVVLAFAQDTLLQETDVSNKAKTSTSCAANLSRLEDRLGHRIRDTERRIIHRFDHKFRLLNQSAAVAHLQDIVDFYTAEMDQARQTNKEQTEQIRVLKTHNSHKQRELHRMKTSLERLKKSVATLNELVEELVQSKNQPATGTVATGSADRGRTGSTTGTGSENEVDQGDAPPSTGVPFKPLFPTDCQYVYESGGMKYPGYYYIMVQPALSEDPFKVCCKMTNHSGWTLLQRRQDGTVDFYRDWQAYKNGFGNLEGEFWLGNEHIYQLTNQGDYKLRIEMKDWDNNEYWVEYDHFRIESEAEKYRLHVHGFRGNAGDSMTSHWQSHNRQLFSTHDQDHDERFYDNCAEHYHGAWWFKSCFESHLNGIYYHKGSHSNYFVRNGIQWNTIHLHSSLQFVSMMVKPNREFTEDAEAANGI